MVRKSEVIKLILYRCACSCGKKRSQFSVIMPLLEKEEETKQRNANLSTGKHRNGIPQSCLILSFADTIYSFEVITEVAAEVTGQKNPAGMGSGTNLIAQKLDAVLQICNVGNHSLHHHHLRREKTHNHEAHK